MRIRPFYYSFSSPSFLSGMARTLDIGGHYDSYNFGPTSEETDIEEISDDWRRVYEDLSCARERIARDNPDLANTLVEIAPPSPESPLPLRALLLHDREQPLASLRLALEKQAVGTVRARSCAEALDILNEDNSPAVVFTDLSVSDGSWADALRLMSETKRPVHFVIVSQSVDVPLYITAMQSGAFDFLVPPFAEDDVAYVMSRAADDVARRLSKEEAYERAG